MQIAEIREICQIAQYIIWQHRSVDAILCLDAGRSVRYEIARGHQHIILHIIPHLRLCFIARRRLAIGQIHLVAAEQNHILIAGRNVDAPPITIVRRAYFAACAAIAWKQAVNIDARDFAAPARALQRFVRVMEHTFECIGDVDAHPHCAIEGPRQILAFIGNAARLLRILLIDAVARFVRRIRAIRECEAAAIVPQINIDLYARTGRLAQTPLAAWPPVAVFLVQSPRGGAHGRRLGDAAFEGARRWHINGHGQIDQCHRAEHQCHLAYAYGATDACVLRRHHQILHGHFLLPHPCFSRPLCVR